MLPCGRVPLANSARPGSFIFQLYKIRGVKQALIIFVRNPEKGKVKTRLAKTTGDEKALTVYRELLAHTHAITKELACDKFVFYADHINENDLWENDVYRKKLQRGARLGERMLEAFMELCRMQYTKIQVIGSDCYELTAEIIEKGFEKLNETDVVIGPSADGGYYLLGTNQVIEELFANKEWSTDSVLKDTLQDIEQLSLSCFQLPLLRDIDTEQDWLHYQNKK